MDLAKDFKKLKKHINKWILLKLFHLTIMDHIIVIVEL